MALNTFGDIAALLGVEPETHEAASVEERRVVYRIGGVEITEEQYLTRIGMRDEYRAWKERQRPLGKLGSVTIAETERLFRDDYKHDPNTEQWKGLNEIAKVYEEMAEGRAEKAFYLSSLPTGMGKTSVAVQSTKAMLTDPEFKNVGVIYFLSRLEEIDRLVKDMALKPETFAVLTSDDTLNALGNPVHDEARVLFTTQQRLENYSKSGTAFAAMKDLRYNGKPRQVRVWDEAILPSLVLTAGNYALKRLPLELHQRKGDALKKLADEIDDFAHSLKSHIGEYVTMPDIDKTGLDLETFRSYFSYSGDKDIAEALWYLSGHVVNVHRDRYSGNVTLGYEDILPDDLAPMLILDASGDLRHTYRFWESNRRTLVRLKSPKKSYAGLTIRHWDKGAGSNKQRDFKAASEIADGVVKMIAEIPEDEPVLVVHHKVDARKGQPDIVREIEKRLPRPKRQGDVRFINWGRHTATNEFRDCRYVILAGVWTFPPASYEAMGRGAQKAKTEEAFSNDDLKATRIGEISHHVLQAAGRGSIRKTVNGGCPEGCYLYAVFSSRSDTGFPKEQLHTIFPDAALEDWKPEGPDEARLSGNVRKAFEFIASMVERLGGCATTAVMRHLGVSKQNFNGNIKNHPDLVAALKGTGIVLDQLPGKPGVYRVKG
ncbi:MULTISPECIES: hypothetical protein [unclassified Mesorhizobium]|uniref:hypothetical protein n=1 Tax=unclassified Mesorhizobium TaxID=325217 RepID=UPI0003CFA443|nr:MULTISPECIES: hypothetical protein [unclassified Mesorhizobium]ESZ03131.1 hypothetical protein X736_26930 [Mesorhizobium sp. L2C089B000]WJI52147.1 hypothetical protein NLY44_05545 [Mesorhizobium sp. C089B]